MARFAMLALALFACVAVAHGGAVQVNHTFTAIAIQPQFGAVIVKMANTPACAVTNSIFKADFTTCDFTFVNDLLAGNKVSKPITCNAKCAEQWGVISSACYIQFVHRMETNDTFGAAATEFFDACTKEFKVDLTAKPTPSPKPSPSPKSPKPSPKSPKPAHSPKPASPSPSPATVSSASIADMTQNATTTTSSGDVTTVPADSTTIINAPVDMPGSGGMSAAAMAGMGAPEAASTPAPAPAPMPEPSPAPAPVPVPSPVMPSPSPSAPAPAPVSSADARAVLLSLLLVVAAAAAHLL